MRKSLLKNPNASKPRYIWIDAAANFPDFANSKENIARDLALAKDAGFTDIVVDVRPTTGDVLFKTNHVDQGQIYVCLDRKQLYQGRKNGNMGLPASLR
ncbi:hypothetical protein NXV53_22715 [Bacteroides faecis]|nr:hypothetical protein [Bacteroides faecis]MCS3327209.1 hypothetical protein [Bacteroides faecis]